MLDVDSLIDLIRRAYPYVRTQNTDMISSKLLIDMEMAMDTYKRMVMDQLAEKNLHKKG